METAFDAESYLSPTLIDSKSQAATATRWTPDEIENQIRLTRQQSGAGGHIHWSMKSLLRSRTLADALAADLYTQPALVPASPWLSATRPGKPLLSVANGNAGTGLRVSWQANSGERAARWVLQTQAANGEWSTDILPAHHTVHELDGPQPSIIAVTAVDRLGNLGPPAAVGLEPRSPPQRLSDEQPPARKRVAPRFASPKERS